MVLKMTLNFSKHSQWDIYYFVFNVAFRVVINFTSYVLKLLEADSIAVWAAFVIELRANVTAMINKLPMLPHSRPRVPLQAWSHVETLRPPMEQYHASLDEKAFVTWPLMFSIYLKR